MTSPPDDAAIRRRIESYGLDHPDDPVPFSRRLQREQGWSAARTARAIVEYRRFVILASIGDHPVSPSPVVDAVWHLHLTDTRRYWEDFCPNVLGWPLHHDPSRGGAEARRRHDAQYQHTLAAYAHVFGQAPPRDLWPGSGGSARRPVGLALAALVHAIGTAPRTAFTIGAASVATLGVAGCAALYDSGAPGAIQGPAFIGGYGLAAMLAVLVTLALQAALERTGGARPANVVPADLGAYELAYLAGGGARVLWTAVLRLRQGGYLLREQGRGRKRLRLGEALPGDAAPVEQGVVKAVVHDRLRGPSAIVAELAQLRDKLVSAGLIAAERGARRGWLAPTLVFGPLMLLGLIRLGFGVEGHRAVGFLVATLVLQMVAMSLLASRRAGVDARARAVLKSARSVLPRRRVGEDDNQMARLVALYGVAALTAGAFADTRPVLAKMAPSGAGDGGSSGGCGGGGGDGGGGCGGGCGGCGG